MTLVSFIRRREWTQYFVGIVVGMYATSNVSIMVLFLAFLIQYLINIALHVDMNELKEYDLIRKKPVNTSNSK